MRRTPLTAMLTLAAALAATVAMAGCGGKEASSSTTKPATSPAPTAPHKHSTKPAY
jgi:hypothetical protein